MPYSVGEKGSYGCSGYPVIKDDDKSVMGCHDTAAEAGAQIAAIEANENKGVGIEDPQEWPVSKADPCWEGYTQRGMKPGKGGQMVPNCVPVSKADAQIVEGDFVRARTTEGIVIGQVEHVMLEGGTYGQPGNPYAVESTPENPAVAIRMLEEEDGVYYYTPYSIGALMSDVERINMPNISMEDYEDDKYMDKAEGYSPPAGARAAARRAIKFKEDGKATGAGTAVGWTRARQLANGETLSLSTVKRMYSYFSRHEVDKKGKDWGNQANPSNGYIMWLAWGGDAGYSWSRRIVESEKNKALFANFGKDWTTSRGLPDLFKSVGVGSMVSWNSSGGRAEGKITRIIRDGRYKVPGTEVTVTGTPDDPAAVIRLYRDGKPTDTIVAHKLKTLRSK
jgi:hypothetical protein